MWKQLQKSPPFFLLFDKRETNYHIFITDYITIWNVYYTEDEFIVRLKESNFGLEMDRSELLDKGNQILQKPSELKNVEINIGDQGIMVTMTMSYGFALKLVVNLQEGSKELFFHKVTQPALKIIQDLRCSQQELRKMLITKDDEIEEYKSFGGKIRYTAIPPYSDETHMRNHCMYNVYYGEAELPPSVLDRIVEVPQEKPKIKEENATETKVKLEPPTQEINLVNANKYTLNTVKKENIKTESQPAMKRKLNL